MAEQTSLADLLGETEPAPRMLTERITRLMDPAEVQELLAQTEAIEQAGGMLTLKGDRRRTRGGVFFALLRERLIATERDSLLQAIFPPPPPRTRQVSPQRSPITTAPAIVARVRHRKKLGPNDPRPLPRPFAAHGQGSPTMTGQAQETHILASIDTRLSVAGVSGIRRRRLDLAARQVQLRFDFPALARRQYGEILAAIGREVQLELCIAPVWNQTAVVELIHELLPADTVQKISIHEAQTMVALKLTTELDEQTMSRLAQLLDERTGLSLTLATSAEPETAEPVADTGLMSSHHALEIARRQFPPATGCYHIGADVAQNQLLLRFHFPDVARERYANEIQSLRDATGWAVALHNEVHHQALEQLARTLLSEAGLHVVKVALHRDTKRLLASVVGQVEPTVEQESYAAFVQASGWSMELRQV